MKDNKQNLTDLIGALAVDIEEIKKKLDAKDSPDKNEALKRLEAKLEPVIRFFNGNAPENVNAIFGSKEAIEKYKQSIGDEAVASLRLYTEANEKDMRKHGVLTIKEQLNKILERLTSHIENDKLTSLVTAGRKAGRGYGELLASLVIMSFDSRCGSRVIHQVAVCTIVHAQRLGNARECSGG